MIESLRLRWPGTGYSAGTNTAAPDLLMLSDRVDGNRRLIGHGAYGDSPGDWLTPQDALSNSAWWRAVNLISSLVARTPFQIKTVIEDPRGIKKTANKDHDGYFATTHQSNPEETAIDARFRITSNAVMYGAGYGAIWRDAPDGLRIYPLETWEIRKVRINGELWYLRDLMPGSDSDDVVKRFVKFPARDMIEISGLKRAGMQAYTTWQLAKNSIADGVEATKMRAARSRNNGRPQLAISTDQALKESDATRIQNDFMRIHAGYDGIGKPAVLDKGMKAAAIPYAPEFLAEEALFQVMTRDVSNWTGVPSVLLGDTAGLSYESLEKLIEALFRFCIETYWTAHEDQIRSKILTDDERRSESQTAEFDRQHMQYMSPADTATMIRVLGAGAPIATPNNIRTRFGMEPLDDPEADKLQMPKNIGHDGSTGTPNPGSGGPGRPAAEVLPGSLKLLPALPVINDQAHRAMANAWDDTTRRILKSAERAASNDKAYMHFCDTLDTDAEYMSVSFERCRAAGSIFGVLVDEATATKGLLACKERLLEVAGVATAGKLHDAFHRESSKLMVILPELAAKAVLGAV